MRYRLLGYKGSKIYILLTSNNKVIRSSNVYFQQIKRPAQDNLAEPELKRRPNAVGVTLLEEEPFLAGALLPAAGEATRSRLQMPGLERLELLVMHRAANAPRGSDTGRD